jgi:hypothetical protein
MKKMAAVIVFIFLAAAACCIDGQPLKFRVYYLIKGEKLRKPEAYSSGVVGVKKFPLRVKTFLRPSRYYDFENSSFKKNAAALFSALDASDRKNSVRIAGFVESYVAKTVTASPEATTPTADPHDSYRPASGILRDGTGNILEKCRLAVALLRYAEIPARVSFWNDSYVVEYYLKPEKKDDPSWQVMDFSGAYENSGDTVIPRSWNPVDSGEHLNEEWKPDTLSVRVDSVKNIYSGMDEAEAMADFAVIESGAEPDARSNTGLSYFYLFKIIDYEILPSNPSGRFSIELTMPFNEIRPFKTMKYFVKPLSAGLEIKMRRSRTDIKPLVKGMMYVLPLDFSIK